MDVDTIFYCYWRRRQHRAKWHSSDPICPRSLDSGIWSFVAMDREQINELYTFFGKDRAILWVKTSWYPCVCVHRIDADSLNSQEVFGFGHSQKLSQSKHQVWALASSEQLYFLRQDPDGLVAVAVATATATPNIGSWCSAEWCFIKNGVPSGSDKQFNVVVVVAIVRLIFII